VTPRRPAALIVEDDDATRSALAELLVGHGCQVVEAADGQAALELLAKSDPTCVILLDWLMPRMNGEDFLARRAASPTLSGIPVIVMSATHDPARDPRIQGFMAKPFKVCDLERLLQEVCAVRCSPAQRAQGQCGRSVQPSDDASP